MSPASSYAAIFPLSRFWFLIAKGYTLKRAKVTGTGGEAQRRQVQGFSCFLRVGLLGGRAGQLSWQSCVTAGGKHRQPERLPWALVSRVLPEGGM